MQSFDHKTKKRDREIRKKIGFPKKEKKNAQYLPGDRVVEILRLPGTGELDDAKKRREERCCCCGSKRGSVFGHVSFCEEAFLCVAIGDSFVHFYLDLSTPRSSSNKNESFLRFPPANRRLQIESSWSSFLSTTI